jgi:TPR repeat protein
MLRTFLFVFICSLFLNLNASANSFFTSNNYWAGKTAYDKGDFKTALRLWEHSANKGIGEAESFVGSLYHAGQGTKKDYKIAMKLYLKSAKQGISRSQLAIGTMYADGHGIKKNNIMARMWFTIAHINKHEQANRYIKRIDTRMTSKEIVESDEKAIIWLNANR